MSNYRCVIFGLLPNGYDAFPRDSRQLYEGYNKNGKYPSIRCSYLTDNNKTTFVFVKDGFFGESNVGESRGGRCFGFAVELYNQFFEEEGIIQNASIIVSRLTSFFNQFLEADDSIFDITSSPPKFNIKDLRDTVGLDEISSIIAQRVQKFISDTCNSKETNLMSKSINLLQPEEKTEESNDQSFNFKSLDASIVEVRFNENIKAIESLKKQHIVNKRLLHVLILLAGFLSLMLFSLIGLLYLNGTIQFQDFGAIFKNESRKEPEEQITSVNIIPDYYIENEHQGNIQYHLLIPQFLEDHPLRSSYPNFETFISSLTDIFYEEMKTAGLINISEEQFIYEFLNNENNTEEFRHIKENGCASNCSRDNLKSALKGIDKRLLIYQN